MFLQQTPTSQDTAAHEGLRYVSDLKPGFSRRLRGKKFSYYDQNSNLIKDPTIVERIHSIGIPPAYKNVWISPWANGHIQATGFDAKGRKQYRYHTKWRSVRDQDKFEHILHFGDALPTIRHKLAKDLKSGTLSREKILATIVSLLEKTLIRVGNIEYAKNNNSYGLTTLRRKHVEINKSTIRFHFKGKSGKEWNLSVNDRRIAATIKKCSELAGYELFKYVAEDGTIHNVNSSDVNTYLKEITHQDFTAKDFRTWSGTVLAAMTLSEFMKYDSAAQAKKNVVRAIEAVSKQLGNTPTICRKCYVHPEIVTAYLSGDLAKMIEIEIEKKFRSTSKHLSAEETMVLAFLRKRLKKKSSRSEHK